ncbi:MAG TPA: Txe/YoeB family addiction module toxin [Devosia sp.]
MRLEFTERGWEHYLYWQNHDQRMLGKINELLKDCLRSPYSGIGKPEPLRQELSGWWSRRINDEHRLVYRVEQDRLQVAQCRYHYSR